MNKRCYWRGVKYCRTKCQIKCCSPADRAVLTNPSALSDRGCLWCLITHILSADDFLKVAHQQFEQTLGQGLWLLEKPQSFIEFLKLCSFVYLMIINWFPNIFESGFSIKTTVALKVLPTSDFIDVNNETFVYHLNCCSYLTSML